MTGELCRRVRPSRRAGVAMVSATSMLIAGLAPAAMAHGGAHDARSGQRRRGASATDAQHRRHRHVKAHAGSSAHAGRSRHRRRGGGGGRKLEASINLKLSPPEPSLPQVQTIHLFVPEGFRDAGRKLPFCRTAVLERKQPEKCPKDTIVGGGTSLGYVFFSNGEYVPEHLELTMFNGPAGALLTWIEGRRPVNIEDLVAGVITAPPGYGQELAFTIPSGLLEPLPGAHGWLVELSATLSGKAGWLRTDSCPPHPWTLAAAFGYTNGQGISVRTKLACR